MTIELELLLGRFIYLHCRTDAIVEILRTKGITVSDEEIENKTQSVWESQFATRRQTFFDDLDRMGRETS